MKDIENYRDTIKNYRCYKEKSISQVLISKAKIKLNL